MTYLQRVMRLQHPYIPSWYPPNWISRLDREAFDYTTKVQRRRLVLGRMIYHYDRPSYGTPPYTVLVARERKLGRVAAVS